MPTVLRPTAAIAPDAILPGDPGRALELAQALLAEPKMSNHAHGLWGYGGETGAGRSLTVQATGIGAPSAALVLRDLAELGVTRAVGVGTCVGLADGAAPGEIVICARAIAADGTSAALGAGREALPDAALTGRLRDAAAAGTRAATVASADLIGGHAPGAALDQRLGDEWAAAGAIAAEMQSAALFTLGERLGIGVACLLVVSDLAQDDDPAALAAPALEAAEIAARALAA